MNSSSSTSSRTGRVLSRLRAARSIAWFFITGALLLLLTTLLSCQREFLGHTSPPPVASGTRVRFFNAGIVRDGKPDAGPIQYSISSVGSSDSAKAPQLAFGQLSQAIAVAPGVQRFTISRPDKVFRQFPDTLAPDVSYIVLSSPYVGSGYSLQAYKNDSLATVVLPSQAGGAPSALARIRAVNLCPDCAYATNGLYYGTVAAVGDPTPNPDGTSSGQVPAAELQGWQLSAPIDVTGTSKYIQFGNGSQSTYRGIRPTTVNFKLASHQRTGDQFTPIANFTYQKIYAPYELKANGSYTVVLYGTYNPDDKLPLTIQVLEEGQGADSSITVTTLKEQANSGKATLRLINAAWNIADQTAQSNGLTVRAGADYIRQGAAYGATSNGYGLVVPAIGDEVLLRLTYANAYAPSLATARFTPEPNVQYSALVLPTGTSTNSPEVLKVVKDTPPSDPTPPRKTGLRIINLAPDLAANGATLLIDGNTYPDAFPAPGESTAYNLVASTPPDPPTTPPDPGKFHKLFVTLRYPDGRNIVYTFQHWDDYYLVNVPSGILAGGYESLVFFGTVDPLHPGRNNLQVGLINEAFPDKLITGVTLSSTSSLNPNLYQLIAADPQFSITAGLIANSLPQTQFVYKNTTANPVTIYPRRNSEWRFQSSSFINGLIHNPSNSAYANRLLQFFTPNFDSVAVVDPAWAALAPEDRKNLITDQNFGSSYQGVVGQFPGPQVPSSPSSDAYGGNQQFASNGYFYPTTGEGGTQFASATYAPTDFRYIFGLRDYIRVDDSLNVLDAAMTRVGLDVTASSTELISYTTPRTNYYTTVVLPIDAALIDKGVPSMTRDQLISYLQAHILEGPGAFNATIPLPATNTAKDGKTPLNFDIRSFSTGSGLAVNGQRVIGRITIDKTALFHTQFYDAGGFFIANPGYNYQGDYTINYNPQFGGYGGPVTVYLVENDIF